MDRSKIAVIGQQVSHFYVIRALGQGGMGVVYEAQDLRLPRSVAIKFLKPGRANDVEAIRRFKREARLASSLNHQNICTVLDVDEGDALSFIVMELLQGVSLKARLAAGPLSLSEILQVAVQVADGLAAAHARGIMHRDITPGNVFLCESGTAKLLDFGLAKQVSASDEDATDDLTVAGRVVGTIHYMAPEQLGPSPEVDHRCDLFSLGAVLYHMVTGARPFEAPTTGDVAAMIQREAHMPIDRLRPGTPPRLSAVIDTLLQKQPGERYASTANLLHELRALQRELDLERARPASSQLAQSIAVLPFRLIAGESPELARLRDGLCEDVAAALAGVHGLRVAPRTSTHAVAHETVSEIGRRLRVPLVVEGSLQQVGESLRVIATVVDAHEERAVGPPFELERRAEWTLAGQRALAQELFGGLEPLVQPRRHVVDPEARQSFQRGLHHWNTGAYAGGWRPAVDYLQDAVAKDPRFVDAHVALARIYNFLGYYCIIRPSLAFAVAGQVADRAIALDDRCASALVELASVRFGRDWDWSGAETLFRRALDVEATHVWARVQYSWLLALTERIDAGVLEAERALAMAPSQPVVATGVAHTRYLARQFEPAIGLCDDVLAQSPDYVFALHVRGLCRLCLRHGDEAIADFERVAVLTKRTPFYLGLLGLCYGEFGERRKGLDLLEELNELSKRVYVHPQCYTFVYTGLHQREKVAFQEQAYEHGASPLNYLAPYVRELYAIDPHRPTRFDQMRLIE